VPVGQVFPRREGNRFHVRVEFPEKLPSALGPGVIPTPGEHLGLPPLGLRGDLIHDERDIAPPEGVVDRLDHGFWCWFSSHCPSSSDEQYGAGAVLDGPTRTP